MPLMYVRGEPVSKRNITSFFLFFSSTVKETKCLRLGSQTIPETSFAGSFWESPKYDIPKASDISPERSVSPTSDNKTS